MSSIFSFISKISRKNDEKENSKNTTVDIEFQDSDDEEESCLGEVKHVDRHRSINIVDARSLIKSARNWSFNRETKEEHIESLKNELLKTDYPFFVGTIKLISEKGSNRVRIIDGQHRYFALQRIIDNNTKFTMEVTLEVYYVNDIDGPEAWDLFYKANNVLNVEEKDKTTCAASFVVTELTREFSKGIYDAKKWVRYPSINKKELFERLKKSDIFKYKTKEQVYNSILKKNIELSKKTLKDFTSMFRSGKDKTRVAKGYDKCSNTGCYLGIHPSKQYTWLMELEVEARDSGKEVVIEENFL